jgi:mRNA-degrading endonuclease RelE of RelBE toxin-antitoxin system
MNDTSGGSGYKGWQIVEHDSFDESVLQCGTHKEIDEALAFVDEALNINPLGFKKLCKGSEIYFVKTKLRFRGTRCFPAYRLLFSVDEKTRTVTKLHVSMSQPEDMKYGNPWDDDGNPYF